MEMIDAQVHIWEKDHPVRPWLASHRGHNRPGARGSRLLPEVTIDQMLMAMTASASRRR
jgi:predicted TIM-barrel fold metal-dependent hydrolase